MNGHGTFDSAVRRRAATTWWVLIAAMLTVESGCGGDPRRPGRDAGGGDGGIGSACEGRTFDEDGVLDLDLKAVPVEGTVTLDGGPWPDGAARGLLVFRDEDRDATARVPLGSSGAETYRRFLPPGTYDVAYESPLECADTAVPCGGAVLLRNVRVESGGRLDIDVGTVSVDGTVTLNGEPFPPDAPDVVNLSFRPAYPATAQPATTPIASDGSFSVTLVGGSYALWYDGENSPCFEPPLPDAPCNSGPLDEEILLDSSGAIDVDVPAAKIMGAITVDGEPMADAADDRGALHFRGADGPGFVVLLGDTGPASYEQTLLKGEYDILFSANDVSSGSLCPGDSPPAVPCVDGTVGTLTVDGDGVADIDMATVAVTGRITVDGAPMPSASAERGWLFFQDPDGGAITSTTAFGTSDGVQYGVRVLEGRYDLIWAANPELCGTTTAPPVPCVTGAIRRDTAFDRSGTLDLDVDAVKVTGNVTLDGETMPDATAERGLLRFEPSDGSARDGPALGASGPARYAATVIAGDYSVYFAADRDRCAGGPAQPVPCVGGLVKESVSMTSDGSLDLDMPGIEVSGMVTLDGMTLPDTSSSRGHIRFLAPAMPFGNADAALGASGPGSYGVHVLPREYVVRYVPDETLCADGGNGLPCAEYALEGCPD